MPSRLNARLARLEQRSDNQPTDAQTNNVMSLLGRLETAAGKTVAEVFHDMECPRGWRGLTPLRDPSTVPEIDAVMWFAGATSGNRVRPPGIPPLCPLCPGPSAA